jgi:hypothetical protein
LSPTDKVARSAIKTQYRELTPEPFRAYINATRPSVGPTAGSQGRANASNAGANALASNLGNIGNGMMVVGAGFEIYNVASAPQGQKLQTVAGAGGRTIGGIGGGVAGAEAGAVIGAYGGPWGAVGGAIIGGLVGSVSGGWAVGQTAEELYLNLTPEDHRY